MALRVFLKDFFASRKEKAPAATGASLVGASAPASNDEWEDTYMFTTSQGAFNTQDLLPSISGADCASRANRWLADRLKKGAKTEFAEIGYLTPEIAALLLERNPSNRSLKTYNIERFARDIENDRFVFNGEPIIVSRTGELNDGQNRCHAVVHAQKSIKTMFVFGVSRESRTTVDQGAARTAGDYLGMDGVANSNNVAAIASKVLEIERLGKLTTTNADRPTKAEIIERAKDDPAIEASFHAVYRAGAAKVASYSLLGTAHYLLSSVSKEDADEFIGKLIDGTNLTARNPIFVAREKLISKERLTQNEKLKTIIMGWNNYRARRLVKNLTHSVKKGEKLPEAK